MMRVLYNVRNRIACLEREGHSFQLEVANYQRAMQCLQVQVGQYLLLETVAIPH